MARPTEQRILEWLNQYDDALENAWDVPRENSLPGIADAIGVVRSALHNPLKNLQERELIIVKQAHVINGGTRKRNVHFITKKGREICTHKESIRSLSVIIGNPPNNIELIGREEELEKINSILSKENILFITGIPGIGKTAIVRYFVEKKAQTGTKIKWYSATNVSSPKTIVETWLGVNKLPSNIGELVTIMKTEVKKDLLIIDNYDQIQARFKDEVNQLILKLSKCDCQIIISSRPPLPKNHIEIFEIFGLKEIAARNLLEGFEKSEINEIVEYFDGHPLGLKMVNEGMSLKSTQKGINKFLENEILAPLSEKNISAIQELAIQPEPIGLESLSFKEQIVDLDDLSLIVFHNNKVQLHNFVKNLLISKMSESERSAMHLNFVKHISSMSSKSTTFLRLFHEINSNNNLNNNWISKNADKICIEKPAKSSALFHDLISKNKDRGEYYWFASLSECELGNGKKAEKLMEKAEKLGVLDTRKNDALILNYRIARLSGEMKKAEEMKNKIKFNNEYERIQFLIADMSRKIDDRLPNQLPNKNSINALKNIKLETLDNKEKRSCLIAISIIKHTFSLYNKKFEKAEEIRDEIIDLTSEDSEILKEMNWKYAIISGREHTHETNNILRNVSLICWKLEYDNSDKLKLLSQLKSIIENNPELENRPVGRRSVALYWTWVGLLDEKKRPFAWTQAIGRWNSSECYNASKTLQKKLHKWLKETGRA